MKGAKVIFLVLSLCAQSSDLICIGGSTILGGTNVLFPHSSNTFGVHLGTTASLITIRQKVTLTEA